MAERLCCDLNSWWENTPDNHGPKPVRNPSPPLRLPSERGATQRTSVANESRGDAASPEFRTSLLSAQARTKTKSKLKTNLCTAGETLSNAQRACESPLGPPGTKDQVFQVKSLNGCRICCSVSPALLGRPDCNESSQTKRDLLTAQGEPAQATLSGSPLPRIRLRSAFAQRVGEVLRAEKRWGPRWLTKLLFLLLLRLLFCQSALIQTSACELSTGDVFTGSCSRASPRQGGLCEQEETLNAHSSS